MNYLGSLNFSSVSGVHQLQPTFPIHTCLSPKVLYMIVGTTSLRHVATRISLDNFMINSAQYITRKQSRITSTQLWGPKCVITGDGMM
jgi:hypothetical protein